MISSLFSGLSGVRSCQTQLEVIGNNISNTNTIGFKAGRATFNDIFNQTLHSAKNSSGKSGGINPQQLGRGVKVGSIDTIFTQGNLQSTNKNTDLAIVGNGFFILSDGANQYFTRDGALDINSDGYLIGPNNLIVQGKIATNGIIAPGAPMGDIHLPIDEKLPPKATTMVALQGNLDSNLSAKTEIHSAADAFTKPISQDTKLNELVQVHSALDNGDKIVISGFRNDGTEVNAEYTYADGDTLQNILDAIETAFGGDITTEIVDGRIVIKDATVGESKTAINLSFVDQGAKSSIALPPFIRTVEGAPGTNQVHTMTMPFTAVADINTDFSELSEVTEALDDGDQIQITGATNDGTTISATYTYTNGDTLQNLLDSINTAFDGTAIATLIDGKIVLKDTTPGTSQTTINLSFVDQGNHSNIKLPSFNTVEGTNPQSVDITFNAFDSAGNTHAITINFSPNGDNNWSWEASIEELDATVIGGRSGTVTFNPDGSLSSFNYDDGLTAFTFNPGNGADEVSVTLDFGSMGKFDGITSFPADSTIMATEQDGYPAGTLENFNIDDAGVIHGVFSNGATQVLAQLTLANFGNPAGLTKIGENLLITSANSGQAYFGDPSTEGLGIISSGSLELSNVALAEEFTNMIIAQRGFQANANVITTTDAVLGDIINLKR
ncbi:MAG: flagellar hook protein FlgE [Candidatus Poribacteria bacterium]